MHAFACVIVVYLDAVLPVDHKALQLHDYPKVVKKPMDLGTIQEKLLNGQYDTLREVRILFFLGGGEGAGMILFSVLRRVFEFQLCSSLWTLNSYGRTRCCTTKTRRTWCTLAFLPVALRYV